MSKQLLFSLTAKDFVFQDKRGSGKGGQHRNVTNSAIRCFHPASGAEGNAQDERSQLHNKRKAFRRCVESEKFKAWHRIEVSKRLGQFVDAEEAVKRSLTPASLKIETQDEEGKWQEIDTERAEIEMLIQELF
jgi:hypothetical protein